MTQNFTNSPSSKGEEMKKPPTIKRMEKEFDDLPYRYAHSGQPNHEVLKKWFSSYLSEVLEYLKVREYKTIDHKKEKYLEFVGSEGSGETMRRWGWNMAVEELTDKIKKLKGEK